MCEKVTVKYQKEFNTTHRLAKFSIWNWTEFVTDMRTFIISFIFKVLPQSDCWLIMQWIWMWNSGILFVQLPPNPTHQTVIFRVILGAPSVATPFSFLQGSTGSLIDSHALKKSCLVAAPGSLLRQASSSITSKDSVTPRKTVTIKQCVYVITFIYYQTKTLSSFNLSLCSLNVATIIFNSSRHCCTRERVSKTVYFSGKISCLCFASICYKFLFQNMFSFFSQEVSNMISCPQCTQELLFALWRHFVPTQDSYLVPPFLPLSKQWQISCLFLNDLKCNA